MRSLPSISTFSENRTWTELGYSFANNLYCENPVEQQEQLCAGVPSVHQCFRFRQFRIFGFFPSRMMCVERFPSCATIT